MKIEDVISGKNNQGNIDLDGLQVPVAALKKLHNDGYVNIRVYGDNRTFSLWGENCTACFTLEQLVERAGQGDAEQG